MAAFRRLGFVISVLETTRKE